MMAEVDLVERMNEAFLAHTDIPETSEIAAALFGPDTPVWVARHSSLQQLSARLRAVGDVALGDILGAVDRTALERALIFALGQLNERNWTDD